MEEAVERTRRADCVSGRPARAREDRSERALAMAAEPAAMTLTFNGDEATLTAEPGIDLESAWRRRGIDHTDTPASPLHEPQHAW